MRKILIFCLCIQLIILPGCSGKQYKTNDGCEEPERQTSFIVWTTKDRYADYYKDAAETWNEYHKNDEIEVKCEVYDREQISYKLWYALQSGFGAPDLVDIPYEYFGKYVVNTNCYLVELNDLIEDNIDLYDRDSLVRYSNDHKYYGIDYQSGSVVIYYNIDILSKSGVNPNNIKTWSDFLQAGLKVKEKTGKSMITIDINNSILYLSILLKRGSDIVDKEGHPDLNNKINLETLQFLYDLIYKYKIAEMAPGSDHLNNNYYKYMNSCGAASVVMPISYMSDFISYMPNLMKKMMAYPMPAWDMGDKYKTAKIGDSCTSITVQCKNIDKAKEFLSFMKLEREGSIRMWEALSADPIIKPLKDDIRLNDTARYTSFFRGNPLNIMRDMADHSHGSQATFQYDELQRIISEELMLKSLSENSVAPNKALVNAQIAAEKE